MTRPPRCRIAADDYVALADSRLENPGRWEGRAMSTSTATLELQRMVLETLRELGPSTLGELGRELGLTECPSPHAPRAGCRTRRAPASPTSATRKSSR